MNVHTPTTLKKLCQLACHIVYFLKAKEVGNVLLLNLQKLAAKGSYNVFRYTWLRQLLAIPDVCIYTSKIWNTCF